MSKSPHPKPYPNLSEEGGYHWKPEVELNDMKTSSNFNWIAAIVLGLILLLALTGCSRKSVAPIVEPVYLHDTLHVFHNDTIRNMDSVIIEHETVIREADSSLLAAYGILGVELQENEKAYLVLQRQMEQRLRELEEKSSDTVYSKVEVPVPTPVIQEVVKPMGWLNKTLRNLGIAAVIAALIYIGIKVWRKQFKLGK